MGIKLGAPTRISDAHTVGFEESSILDVLSSIGAYIMENLNDEHQIITVNFLQLSDGGWAGFLTYGEKI